MTSDGNMRRILGGLLERELRSGSERSRKKRLGGNCGKWVSLLWDIGEFDRRPATGVRVGVIFLQRSRACDCHTDLLAVCLLGYQALHSR